MRPDGVRAAGPRHVSGDHRRRRWFAAMVFLFVVGRCSGESWMPTIRDFCSDWSGSNDGQTIDAKPAASVEVHVVIRVNGRHYSSKDLRSTMTASLLSAACAALAILSPSAAFVPSPGNHAAAKASLSMRGVEARKTSQLMMATRRDILSSAAASVVGLVVLGPGDEAVAFQPGPVTAQSAANKAAYAQSYQGVYSDPNHPEGYRIIMASDKGGATMTFSDGVAKDAPEGTEAETYTNLPIAMKEGTNNNELTFDFSFSE